MLRRWQCEDDKTRVSTKLLLLRLSSLTQTLLNPEFSRNVRKVIGSIFSSRINREWRCCPSSAIVTHSWARCLDLNRRRPGQKMEAPVKFVIMLRRTYVTNTTKVYVQPFQFGFLLNWKCSLDSLQRRPAPSFSKVLHLPFSKYRRPVSVFIEGILQFLMWLYT